MDLVAFHDVTSTRVTADAVRERLLAVTKDLSGRLRLLPTYTYTQRDNLNFDRKVWRCDFRLRRHDRHRVES